MTLTKSKILIFAVSLFIFILPFHFSKAQNEAPKDQIFKARVAEILEEKENTLPDGKTVFQQNIKLEGLEKEFKDKEIIFYGIGDYDPIKKNIYKKGDKVLVAVNYDEEGREIYFITDYIRTSPIIWLFVLFAFFMLVVGKFKGFRAVLSLALTFFVIIKYIVPQILDGADPVITTIIGSLLILLFIIYFTEGLNKKSHIAVLSILICLILSAVISWIFVEIAKLSGVASEEMFYLVDIGQNVINFKGLLLAGIIIGTLGVLDDVVVSQIATVEKIIKADTARNKKEIFKDAHAVGVSHISSMANTLFLAYAGASFPLLILFASGTSAFGSWGDIVNEEIIATEIVRTLAGSIGLISAVPVSCFLGVVFLKK